jgi:hypothetical protein
LERQREGIATAKQRGGVYTGRKPAFTAAQAQQLRERAAAGERKSDPTTGCDRVGRGCEDGRRDEHSTLAPCHSNDLGGRVSTTLDVPFQGCHRLRKAALTAAGSVGASEVEGEAARRVIVVGRDAREPTGSRRRSSVVELRSVVLRGVPAAP